MTTTAADIVEQGIERARSTMAEYAFDYCVGGAGDESGVRRNEASLDKVCFIPRVLRDVSSPDPSTELLGTRLAAPLLVAPMGLQALCHEESERATAAAAGSLGLGFCLSTFGSRPVEEFAPVADGPLWQQVYLLRERAVTWSLVERAEAAGAHALICTVDVPVVGRRRRDSRNGFRRFEVAPPALARDPCFLELLMLRQRRDPSYTAAKLVDDVFPDPSVNWDDLAELKAHTRLPIVLKGVLHPADASRAVAAGMAAVAVSTHGGRQHDRHIAAIDALPGVLAAVDDRIPVLFDSGIRRGSHVAAALAFGASAVLVGRPVLWGLATGGQLGARRVLAVLVEDLVHIMALLGIGRVHEFGPDLIHHWGARDR